MKNLATFIRKHFPALSMEIYYIIDYERYGPEPEIYSDEYIAQDLPF